MVQADSGCRVPMPRHTHDQVGTDRTVADIYRDAAAQPFQSFKETALAHLRQQIPFDAAVWGSGIFSENLVLSVACLDFPAEKLLMYADSWQADDYVRLAAIANPGGAMRIEDVMPRAQYERTDIYRLYSKPAGIEHAIGIARYEPVSDLGDVILLFRADSKRPFSDVERRLLEGLSLHLVNAWEQSQILYHYCALAEGSVIGPADPRCHAVCDGQGLLHAAGPLFCRALRDTAPNWTGPRLLPVLTPLLTPTMSSGPRVAGEPGLSFASRKVGDRFLLSALTMSPIAGLTGAESRAARLYAAGLSQPAIAGRLNLSKATVRNQLASAYQKLHVHTKIELARALTRNVQ